MIQEAYVSFETAKLLKEKGFYSEDCFAFYKKNGEIGFLQTFGDIADYDSETCVIAPNQALAMKWLREVHNIFISIAFCTYPTEKRVTWTPEISTFDSVYPESAIEYEPYEEACESAIKYCLENLI